MEEEQGPCFTCKRDTTIQLGPRWVCARCIHWFDIDGVHFLEEVFLKSKRLSPNKRPPGGFYYGHRKRNTGSAKE